MRDSRKAGAYSQSMAAVSAHEVAAAIQARLPGVDQMKLQKLLYFAQGHHLADFGELLFREDIEAWKYGPVVRVVYEADRDHTEWPETRPEMTVSRAKHGRRGTEPLWK